MAIHLISDLHLSDETPELKQLLLSTLAAWSGRIDALYILGDLFEYWVGDDDDNPFIQDMVSALAQFSARTPLHVMRGNRDFLLGAGFAARSGAQLLEDPALLERGGRRYLLSHGDALCRDDLPYQQFRALSRQPAWQQAMLARPLAERHAIARQARAQSETQKLAQGMHPISDVSDSAVLELLEQYDWPILIHGHTHRPACHEIGKGERRSQRWVIADWHDAHGAYLRLDDDGLQSLPLG
jgi:UDP-2,3-diacylglucosamine hydrolase